MRHATLVANATSAGIDPYETESLCFALCLVLLRGDPRVREYFPDGVLSRAESWYQAIRQQERRK